MDSSSNTSDSNTNTFESPQPHKKRKLSSQKSKSIHYATRSQSNKNKNNSKKRRLNNTNSSRNNKNKNNKKSLSLRDKVEPWWIGQRIIVQIHSNTNNNNSNNKKSKNFHKHFNKIGREATIRDYNPNTQLSHIWFETEDNNFENVDLLKLEDWDIPNDKPIHKQIEFVPHNQWIAPQWKMKQRVLVKFDGKYGMGAQFAAFIDGYDPVSRRHHINYGDTTEWIWARKERVQIFKGKCDNYIEEKLKRFRKNRDEVIPPPWNPIPYGLDETFELSSKEIHKNDNTNIVLDNNKNISVSPSPIQNDKQRIKIFANKTHPRRQLNDVVQSCVSARTSALIKKTKSISLNKLLKSNHSKFENKAKNRITKRREKQESEDTILDNSNNDSVTSVSSSSSSSESTFDTKTYQETTDSDNDMRIRKQRTFENNKKNTQNKDKDKDKKDDKHAQVSSNTANTSTSNNTQKPSKKQAKKKKISIRIPKKAHTKSKSYISKTKNRINEPQNTKPNSSQQTQTIPLHLQRIPITHSINTINTINTNINNTVSRPIVLHQLPMQSMMPMSNTMNNIPLFIPGVQQQQQQQQRTQTQNSNLKFKTNILQKQKKCNNNKFKKKKLYPRTAIIKGEKWVRHYSKSDRKYYWLLHNDKNDIVDKEWDPWRKHGKKAPWMISMQKWGKFKDPNEKKEYYYNYQTKQSTFKRPKGFESDAEIQYDSADDNYTQKWQK